MYKFIGLLAFIASSLAAPRPGLFLQAQPLATSYSNAYQHVVKSALPLVSAQLVQPAPVLAPFATSYANVYQKIESTPVIAEKPVEEPEIDEPMAEQEPEIEIEQEPEAETEIETEIETVQEVEPEVAVKVEEPVEVQETFAVAPTATSYANVYQKIETQPIVKAALVAAAPTYAVSQPAIYASAPLVRSAAIVAAPTFAYASHPVSYVQTSSLW